jgi:hypothetical protein
MHTLSSFASAFSNYSIGIIGLQGKFDEMWLWAYPSTVPIDSTLPFPFVSVLTRSVSVLKALGLI